MEIFPFEIFKWALRAFLCGVIMGVLYDVLRLSRAMMGYHYIPAESPIIKNRFTDRFPIKKNDHVTGKAYFKLILFIEDVLFVLIFCAAFVFVLFYGNNGEFRAIFLFAIILGFSSYYISFGRLTVLFFDLWVIYIRAIFCHVIYCALLPIRFLLGQCIKGFKKILYIFSQLLENIKIKRYNKKERNRLLALSQKGMI